MASFIILTLPRSRSRWLSEYLSYGGQVGHDLAIGCSSVEEFLARLDGVEGSVETGAVLGWRLLKKLRPSMRQIVVSRPFREILRSLDRAGFPYDRNELIERQALLDMAKSNASMAVTFEQLEDREERRILWEYLIDSEWDEEWDRRVSETKIEVEPKTRMNLLAANRARTEELKRDLAQLLAAMSGEMEVEGWKPEVEVGLEPLSAVWPELTVLGERHAAEVGDKQWNEIRPFELNGDILQSMQDRGSFHVIAARASGLLVGYLTLQLYRDPESNGRLTADQGAWYVAPEFARRGIGHRLFREAIRLLKETGVSYWFPHHRLAGRGERLDKFLRSQGAVEVKREYMMPL